MAEASAAAVRARRQAVINSAVRFAATETVAHCASTREIADPDDLAHARDAMQRARRKEDDVLADATSMVSACEAAFKKQIEAEYREMISLYKQNYDLQGRVISMLVTIGAVPLPSGVAGQPSVYNVASAAERVRVSFSSAEMRGTEQGRRAMQHMITLDARFQRADAVLARLRRLAETHVERRDKRCFLTEDHLGADPLVRVVELVDYRSVLQFMLCSREFRALPAARQRLPHLSVRHCVGYFPHSTLPAAEGVRNFVNKKDVVKLYIDFAVRGAKLACEAGPQTAAHAAPPQGDAHRYVPRHERLVQEEESNMKRCRHAPEEPAGPEAYRVRLPTGAYFDEPIDCSVELVFEHDKQPVPATRHVSPLSFSRPMLSPGAPTKTFTTADGVPYPAHLAFKVNALSCEHSGRLFALKVTGRTRAGGDAAHALDQSSHVELVAYSRPFLVMANASSSASYAARPKRARDGGR
jgi:hypothetical protein